MAKGLLDFISTPEGQGLLSAAFGGLAGARRGQPLNSIGRAGLAGLSGYVDATDRVTQQDQLAKRNQLFDVQLAQAQQQMADAQTARAQESEFRNKIPSPQESMIQGALGGNRRPTMANAQQLTPVDPRQQLMFDAMRLGQMKPSEYLTATAKDDTPMILPEGANLVGGRASNFKVLASGSPKAGKESNVAQLLSEMAALPPDDPRRAIYSDAIKKATTNPPAVNVTVGTGKVGELETSYRREFNALPEVTRYKSAVPAFKAVQGAATRPGTQSEINLIYGLAKLYDPESVVREGEYDTIANSQSIPEWLKGQAQRLAGGGKLTPETKSQILTEARARIQALEDEYSGVQRTYDGIARRQGLDPQNIFTPVGGYAAPETNKPKSRLVTLDGGGSATATLGADGNYYIKRGGKTYRVED